MVVGVFKIQTLEGVVGRAATTALAIIGVEVESLWPRKEPIAEYAVEAQQYVIMERGCTIL